MVENEDGGVGGGGRGVVDVEGLGGMAGMRDADVLGEVLGPGR